MTAEKYYKGDIATAQLHTAITLFLNDRDRSSIIKLQVRLAAQCEPAEPMGPPYDQSNHL
jgi:hypothetical protein